MKPKPEPAEPAPEPRDPGDELVRDTMTDALFVGIVSTAALFWELGRSPMWGAAIGVGTAVVLVILRTVLQAAFGWKEGRNVGKESRLRTKLLSWGVTMAILFAVWAALAGAGGAWAIVSAAASYVAIRTVWRHRAG